MAVFDVNTTGNQVVQDFGDRGKNKTIVITGPSAGGLGAEIATTLAEAQPSRILLVGRNEDKIRPVLQAITTRHPSIDVSFIRCDLSNNASVRQAAEEITGRVQKIDVLINNAAIMATRSFDVSEDGVESQFAAGYLGHFLLTNLLKDKIIAARGIVINMTSSGYMLSDVDTDDANFEGGNKYDPWLAYARTKTAGILFTHGLCHKYGSYGVASLAVDPGMVPETNLMHNSGVDDDLMAKGIAMAVEMNGGKELPPHPLVSIQQGCAGAVLAALSPSLREHGPAFVKECAVTPVLPFACDPRTVTNLWRLSEQLVKARFD